MRLLNLIGMGKAIVMHRLGINTPVNVMWRITNQCNSHCSYCGIWKKKQKELTTAQILKIMEEMKGLGTQRIGFVGGEALLRKDFGKILGRARQHGFYTTLVSNGCLVPDNMPVLRKLDCLVISFDGRKKNHDRGRMKGSYENVIRAFGACKNNKIRVLTNTVLNRHNLKDIDFVLDTVKSYGFCATFNLLQGGEYPKNSDYRKALRHLLKRKESGAPIVLSKKAIRFLLRWPDYSKCMTDKGVKGFRCYAGELIYNIDTDGKIAACDIMTHARENPSAAELGLKEAMRLVRKDCKACTCAHVIEYNYMFSLSPSVIRDWARAVF